ncbi:MAG: peptidylprolyl isomerase, partial [Planctomycetota bacterium]
AVAVTRDPVPSEADNGLSNSVLYSVALALSRGDPDSGTTQFFINLSEANSFLDDQGFTVFGQVIEGTNVVDDIAALETIASPIIPGEVSLPAEDVIMGRVTRVSIVE